MYLFLSKIYSFRCEKREYASFQCQDYSDEMECEYEPKPLPYNPAVTSLSYDKQEKCFKQSFTFSGLNQTLMDLNYPGKRQQEFAKEYELSSTKLAVLVSLALSGVLCLVAIGLLLCFGNLNKRCKTMRRTFIVLAVIYMLCIVQTLLTGIFWVKYIKALNGVMENLNGSNNMYDQVVLETIRVTGGLATIRISTQLTFYNCGFYGLAMILCLIASHLLRNASCHTRGSMSLSGDYKRNMYSDDQLTANGLLLGPGSSNDSTDNGVATPDQMVTPHRSIRSYDANLLQARTMQLPSKYYSNNHISGTNTYISYKDDSIDRLSQPLTITTLDRSTVRSTPV